MYNPQYIFLTYPTFLMPKSNNSDPLREFHLQNMAIKHRSAPEPRRPCIINFNSWNGVAAEGSQNLRFLLWFQHLQNLQIFDPPKKLWGLGQNYRVLNWVN